MIRKGSQVVYPKHGAGKIIDIYNEHINGNEVQYYKIQFFNSPATVAIPAKKAKEMGLRLPLSKNVLKKALQQLGKSVPITKNTLKDLDVFSKEKLESGKFEDVIELINTLKSLAKHKEEENKNFSYSYMDRLEIAHDFITSEITMVLGKAAIQKYDL